MTANEMMEVLHALIVEHGDLEVVMDDESTPSVEFNDQDGPPVFVVS